MTSGSTAPAVAANETVADAVVRYASRIHAVAGSDHHVASPLGAWMLAAITGACATGKRRAELSRALEMDVGDAAVAAGRLLQTKHPVVGAGAGLWIDARLANERLAPFLASLPVPLDRGTALPSADALDAWTRKHTLGLIDRFPSRPGPDATLLTATALATRVEWQEPYKVALSSELGSSTDWSRRVKRVLTSAHRTSIVRSDRAGLIAVHHAVAKEGLGVTSVIADPDVPSRTVLEEAYRMAMAIARDALQPISLFDLPLGKSACWTIVEKEERELGKPKPERFRVLLPAWEASSSLDLSGPELGLLAAGDAIAEAAGVPKPRIASAQAALARYTRTGFEAAAVSDLLFGAASPQRFPSKVRTATVRFGHPFAAVATTMGKDWSLQARDFVVSPWHGIPVFSAWVTKPTETEAASQSDWG